MEHGIDSIKLAVGIIIVCVVVALAFFVTRTGKNQVNQATAQLVDVTSQYDEPSKQVYDGIMADGKEVIETINKFATDDTVAVRVVHRNDTVDIYNGVDITATEGALTKTDTGAYNTANTRTDAKYINPGATFVGSVQRNSDDVIVCITFTQSKM